MTREEAIDWLEHAQNGLTGHIGEALRIAMEDMRFMQKISGTAQSIADARIAEAGCTDGACPIHYKEDL